MSISASTTLQELLVPMKEALERVRQSLLEIVPPDSLVLAKTVQQSLTSGGKYLRPTVTLLCGKATSVDADEHALVEVAAVAEMIHIATLLHDDVLDESDLRRGKRTVRAEFGNRISVLSGDFLLAQASLKLSRLGNTRLVAIFAQVLADLCDGEVEQLHTSFSLGTSWDSYYKKTLGKTASLFSAGCASAGVVNGLPEEHIQALKQYGQSYGMAFQIIDDLLDYTSSEAEMGKPVMDDLRNGLLNAPILLALESELLSDMEQADFRQAIQQLFEGEASAIDAIRAYLETTQAIERTRALAESHMNQARRALAFVPSGVDKDALLALVDYIAERRH